MFCLRAVSEDDTIFLQNEYLFGDLNRPGAPTLGRFFYENISNLRLFVTILTLEL